MGPLRRISPYALGGALAALIAGAAQAAPAAGAADPAPTPFGVALGADPAAVKAAFKPLGQPQAATWSVTARGRVQALTWRCAATDRCFATPSGAAFWFVDGRLASATLTLDPGRAALGTPRGAGLAGLQGQSPVAQANAGGRRVRYYRPKTGQPATTTVWIEDGAEGQLKLYQDALHPVGFAEAVAAGAPPQGLQAVAGGKAYGAAQVALSARDFSGAISALEGALAEPAASPLLKDEARLVLALSLAARAKARASGDPAGARADLDRAGTLLPALAEDLKALRAQLGLGDTPP